MGSETSDPEDATDVAEGVVVSAESAAPVVGGRMDIAVSWLSAALVRAIACIGSAGSDETTKVNCFPHLAHLGPKRPGRTPLTVIV